MRTLVVLVGLPRSGKSSWARDQKWPIVCPDAIRLALHGKPFLESMEPYVWSIARTMVNSLFLSGHETVILDACNVSKYRRNEWNRKKGDIVPEWKVSYVAFTTSVQECKARAIATNQEYLLPIIERMVAQWDWAVPLKKE